MLLEIKRVEGDFNSTKFVDLFSDKLGRSRSGAWECLNSLKRMGLLDVDLSKRGRRQIRLTKLGTIVLSGEYGR